MALLYPEQVEFMSIDEMQETHENEIALLNAIDKLADGYESGDVTKEALEEKLDAYIDHVQKHFANEEALMQKYAFPSFEMHQMAHEMFLADLTYATKNWKEYGNIQKTINFVRKTPEWIVMHVRSVDAPTADYIARKMDAL